MKIKTTTAEYAALHQTNLPAARKALRKKPGVKEKRVRRKKTTGFNRSRYYECIVFEYEE